MQKSIKLESATLLATSLLVTAIGAYQLGRKASDPSNMRTSFLASLLSLSFLSKSTTNTDAFQSSIPNVSTLTLESSNQSSLSSTNIDNEETNNNETEKSVDEKNTPIIQAKVQEKTKARVDEPDASLMNSITMQPVGHISSVYRLCVGTPRQGLLAPNSRGRIDLDPNRIAPDSVLSLDQFSHVWIVFVFHLNSNVKSVERSKQTKEEGKVAKRQFPSKIKPPALGGKKVGIFATRTPHRPNQIGFSLCKVDKVVIPKKKRHQKASEVPYHVYVSGLDLVDGTPVLDIKPYVPHYDSVGFMYQHGLGMEEKARIPQWISDGLDKRREVIFSKESEEQLKNIIMGDEKKELEFYGTDTGRDASDEEAFDSIKSCIEDVLSVDVRSKWQTKKARLGKSRAETAKRVKEIQQEDIQEESEKEHRNFK
ncbi:hypothetical protein CTEN210_14537 [Chaetoceros tenuissimus]|uniref:TsaA-like domain-containing protein n=1 Tax=Chaetoceros tenuissimus TaxID=426638 RepID=A0AAD3D561_9STRA|nr:hypothetical protein CTEN210_14537 [Chaetoceros tenuissimus]